MFWPFRSRLSAATATLTIVMASAPSLAAAQRVSIQLPGYGAGGPASSSTAPPGAAAISGRVRATLPVYDANRGVIVNAAGRIVATTRENAPLPARQYVGNSSATQPGFASAVAPAPDAAWQPRRGPEVVLAPAVSIVADDRPVSLQATLIGGMGPVSVRYVVRDDVGTVLTQGQIAWWPGEAGAKPLTVPISGAGIAGQLVVSVIDPRGATIAGDGSARIVMRRRQAPAWINRPGCAAGDGQGCPVLQGYPAPVPFGSLQAPMPARRGDSLPGR